MSIEKPENDPKMEELLETRERIEGVIAELEKTSAVRSLMALGALKIGGATIPEEIKVKINAHPDAVLYFAMVDLLREAK